MSKGALDQLILRSACHAFGKFDMITKRTYLLSDRGCFGTVPVLPRQKCSLTEVYLASLNGESPEDVLPCLNVSGKINNGPANLPRGHTLIIQLTRV